MANRTAALTEVAGDPLAELAHHSGAILLEIGTTTGESAVAALRLALQAHESHGRPRPQYYGLTREASAVRQTLQALHGAGLAEYGLVYHGALSHFRRDIPITPTLVARAAAGGYAGVWADLRLLSTFLAANTPVVCYGDDSSVRRAIDEWAQAGFFDRVEPVGPAIVLHASSRCSGHVQGVEPERFERLSAMLLARYLGHEGLRSDRPTPVHGLTRLARDQNLATHLDRGMCGHGPWPATAPDVPPLPGTLPDGTPWPTISIITPSYNQGRYLRDTLLSVAHQNYSNVQHIVIDGGSTDETAAILHAYRGHLAYWVSEPDNGQSHALNKGFGRATGDILTWLNSDDQLAPGALAAVALAFHASSADMVAGICQLHRNGPVVEQHLTSCANGPLPLDDLLDLEHCWNAGQFFHQPEVFFTRSLWEAAGGQVDEQLYYSMDYELWLRFAERGARLHVIGRPLALFRQHPEQKTHVPERFQAELRQVRAAFLRRTGRALRPERAAATSRSLRVTFFNDLGFHYGAGTAHHRLAQAVAAAGHQVESLAVLEEPSQYTSCVVSDELILRRIEQGRPDVVVLGNVHGASVHPHTLAQIAERWPTLFVLHDLWLFTGRCAYTAGCTQYRTGCDHTCPTPHEPPRLEPERIRDAWTAKRRLLAGPHAPVLLANSDWMRQFAEALFPPVPHRAGSPGAPPIQTLGLGFPLEVFRPRDQRLCRELLDLPADRFIILASGSTVADPRKGIHHLAQALRQLQLPDVLVVALGRFEPGQAPPIPGMRALGYLTDPQRLAMLFAAADLFVGPSLEEAFGQVFIEAAACGTPSVGYPVGGIPEAVVDGVTGRLAAAVNPDALAEAIEELYAQPEYRRQLGQWGRLYVENEFSLAGVYHRWMTALAAVGLRDRLGLPPKIALLPELPALGSLQHLYVGVPRWRGLTGFGDWEEFGPGRPRLRKAFGPVSRFQVHPRQPGGHELCITAHNAHAGQRLRLVHQGQRVAECSVPVTRPARPAVLRFEVDLAAGVNTLEMHHYQWNLGDDEHPTALTIVAIDFVPVPGVRRAFTAKSA